MKGLTTEQKDFLIRMGEFSDETNSFEKMFNLQLKFDKSLEEKKQLNFENDEYRKLSILALLSETAELLDECDWPWWKNVKEEKEGIINELRDLQHFILKLQGLQGITPDVFYKSIEKGDSFEDAIKRTVEETSVKLNETGIESFLDKIVELNSVLSTIYLNIGSSSERGCKKVSNELVIYAQKLIFVMFADEGGFGLDDIFLSYIDKNIENHKRQEGKSSDQTRNNYSSSGPQTTFKKMDNGDFLIKNEEGHEFVLTKETLFELKRK